MENQQTPKPSGLSGHFNAFQYKSDLWSRFEHCSKHLANDDFNDVDSKQALVDQAKSAFVDIKEIERYWAFPGRAALEIIDNDLSHNSFKKVNEHILMIKEKHSTLLPHQKIVAQQELNAEGAFKAALDNKENFKSSDDRLLFTVLFVIDESEEALRNIAAHVASLQDRDDKFKYNVLILHSVEEALIATSLNYDIQACVIYFDIPLKEKECEIKLPALNHLIKTIHCGCNFENKNYSEMGVECGKLKLSIRPNLDLFLISDVSTDEYSNQNNIFRKQFYTHDNSFEIYSSIITKIKHRFETPFFNSLVHYSKEPKGSFHALPVARAGSVSKSKWIIDMLKFYGPEIFMAETSATSGGLDSLLEPKGSIKKAQEQAARTFGANETYFVTSGTSTSNKIVLEALVKPGDIVLADHSSHISHHYSMILTGANVVYLDAYPLNEYLIYGAVTLRSIKEKLLILRDEGLLDKVKVLLLTNCTFDGLIYNVERFMEEILAIKPDIVFVWDEAWFAYARCNPLHRTRTAMFCARKLTNKYQSKNYRKQYNKYIDENADKLNSDEFILQDGLLPDPDKLSVRVYATQSTHKSLSSFRQGSMIHVHDELFSKEMGSRFHESYLMHTTTSPNYQLIASLDLARRQVDFEGYRLGEEMIEMAMSIRSIIRKDELLSKYFHVLGPDELIPAEYRQSDIHSGYNAEKDWEKVTEAWKHDDYVVCPSRITIYTANTGIEGCVLKNSYLMDKHNIQVNKNSMNTLLVMTTIGTTRSSVSQIINALTEIAKEIEIKLSDSKEATLNLHQDQVESLTNHSLELPLFTHLHESFLSKKDSIAGVLRDAYYKGYDESECEYILLNSEKMDRYLKEGREIISAVFITPCPPGYPALVPGQVASKEIIEFLSALNPGNINGYDQELGIKIFKTK